MPRPDPVALDDLLLSRVRLGILSALVGGDEASFTYLRDALKLTHGNLSVQLRKLETAGYLKIRKRFVDRKPRTLCRITPRGQAAFEQLVRHLEGVLQADTEAS